MGREKHHIHRRGKLRQRRRQLSPAGTEPLNSLRAHVVDVDIVLAIQEVPAHRSPYVAETHEPEGRSRLPTPTNTPTSESFLENVPSGKTSTLTFSPPVFGSMLRPLCYIRTYNFLLCQHILFSPVSIVFDAFSKTRVFSRRRMTRSGLRKVKKSRKEALTGLGSAMPLGCCLVDRGSL